MDAIQYGVNYHSNKTSWAKSLHGTVESPLTATSLQWPLFLSRQTVHALTLFIKHL